MHNIGDDAAAQLHYTTDNWYDNGFYSNTWHNQDFTMPQQPAQLTLPPPLPAGAGEGQQAPIHIIAAISIQAMGATSIQDGNQATIMIDSGAAAHVCPPWFANSYPLHPLAQDSNQQANTALRSEMGLHASTRTTKRHTILCV